MPSPEYRDKYHTPWDQFIAALTLLQVPVTIEKKPSRQWRVTVAAEHEDQLRAVFKGYKLYRAKRESRLDVFMVCYYIDASRFTFGGKRPDDIIYIGHSK